MKNPKTSFRVEPHNGRLYLHGQNAAQFSSRGRRMPSTVCRLFSYLLVHLRRYPNGGGVCIGLHFRTQTKTPHTFCNPSLSVPCGGTSGGILVQPHFSSSDTACFAVLNAANTFAFVFFHGGQLNRVCSVFNLLSCNFRSISDFLWRHNAFVFLHFKFLLLIFHNGTFKL